ncbi:hypothetical protein BU24DRAFT_453211 [Aaosphaeria arxii CBS 175.79]|uniref:Uncharacterized protein n=1 Tax=Aaosphaeria arxii CBS 175.79 TaxID=1450172 RepID=A0A6A5XJ52_9PLEO|nr:uncharacterized protein BU24DRAFT_453211 [Aaosphaeria arxii CBS 175.79]KAF2012896.1 hypothetical protein BU24DRAFT_453211 [Aaosphaeria arxii CBS 175.79]
MSNASKSSVVTLTEKSKEKREARSITYHSFETSVKQIHEARGKILSPLKSFIDGQWRIDDESKCGSNPPWKDLGCESKAERYIRTTPVRNDMRNYAQNRFRILVVQFSDMKQLDEQKVLLKAAKAAHWISNVFETFIANHTVGSAVRESNNSLSFMAQTPHDDLLPFFSLSLTSHHGYGYESAPDWTALIFLGPSSPEHKLDMKVLSDLLDHEVYPSDYSPYLSPDLMILPVTLMRFQVNEIATGVAKMRKEILEVDKDLLNPKIYKMKELRKVKAHLFNLRRTQGSLHQRYLFAKELAANLEQTFETLRTKATNESGERSIEYSESLVEAVQAHSFILGTLKHEVTTAAPRIEAQQTMIANNSYLAAEEARRDSASMKTVAVVTLVFLPGTFVAVRFPSFE